MDRKIALKWARALESGKYKQTYSQLRSEYNSFCCLGVLCNLHAQEHPEIAAEQTDPTLYMGSCGTLPIPVMEWAGMWSDGGGLREAIEVKVKDDTKWIRDLIELNDEYHLNFQQIAKVIREHSHEL